MSQRFPRVVLWIILACVTATLPVACGDDAPDNADGSLRDSAIEVAPGPMTPG
jgi:hypothetical protein